VRLRRDYDRAPIVTCTGKPLLGEWIKSELDKRGLTEEWYKARKGELGLPETCGCDWRKKFLDWVDAKVRELV
jgi:hypothetical protein